MSSTFPIPEADKGKGRIEPRIVALREQLADDLRTFLDADVHISGYIVAWISRNMDLVDLEDLVDELDSVYTVNGRSILGRKK